MSTSYSKPVMPRAINPLLADAATIERFIAHCHRRKYPARTDVFRPGDPPARCTTSCPARSASSPARMTAASWCWATSARRVRRRDGPVRRSDSRGVILRTRTACELAEIGYERLQQLLTTQANDAARLLYSIGAQISQRLLDTSRKAGRLAFLDVTDRIYRTLFDLAREPDAMSHPQGTQLRVSRQELARLVGCSREMAGRVLKKLQADGKLHARGKTVVVYGTRD
jgi:CRP/FNR family cyclic AMP-dependent transcriptional regulator